MNGPNASGLLQPSSFSPSRISAAAVPGHADSDHPAAGSNPFRARPDPDEDWRLISCSDFRNVHCPDVRFITMLYIDLTHAYDLLADRFTNSCSNYQTGLIASKSAYQRDPRIFAPTNQTAGSAVSS